MQPSSNKKQPTPPPLPRPWRRAIEQMDHALEQNSPADFSERIEIVGRQLFGDLWKPRKPEITSGATDHSPASE
jgi:hypothetical protein